MLNGENFTPSSAVAKPSLVPPMDNGVIAYKQIKNLLLFECSHLNGVNGYFIVISIY